MNKLILSVLALLSILFLSSTCSASQRLQDSVGVDRFAHAGISYVICDQLHRNAGFNPFWSAFTTLAIGAAKEVWIDKNWDNGDFAADCAGVLVWTW